MCVALLARLYKLAYNLNTTYRASKDIIMVFLPHWPKSTKLSQAIILGTERVLNALEFFGNPQHRLPPVIHVSGTNGKGSTVSYIANILRTAGHKTHVYTSPHLVDYNERIVINDRQISDAHLFDIMEECRIMVEKHSLMLTWFEAATVAAINAFSRASADFLVLEVGMGGRSDATNVIDNPYLSIITSISFDHREFLGDTLPAIAFEKAGIIKPNCPCVIGKQTDENVYKLLEAYADSMHSTLLGYGGGGWLCRKIDNGLMQFESKYLTTELPVPSLIGDHQIDNAGNAVAALTLAKHVHKLDISVEQISNGLITTRWPARMERVLSKFVTDNIPQSWEVYLDGAHNDGGALALSEWAKQNSSFPIYLILGMTKGKDVLSFLSILKPHVKFVCGICVHRELNSERGEAISAVADLLTIPTKAFDYLPRALQWITQNEQHPQVKILICGSLYLASDIKRMESGILV